MEAIRVFNKLKFKVIIATNQSGISRRYYNVELLIKINKAFTVKIVCSVGAKVDSAFFCPHLPGTQMLMSKASSRYAQEKFYRDTSDKPNALHFFGGPYKDSLAVAKSIRAKFYIN